MVDSLRCAPLTESEERTWRAFMRLVLVVPRALQDDLERTGGLSMTEYTVLMLLSEAPQRSLRMSDLATRSALSPSRMTRAVDTLGAAGLVERRRCDSDGRAMMARLTDAGMAQLRTAWPHHLASVRARFIDVLDPDDVAVLGRLLDRVINALDCPANSSNASDTADGARAVP